MPPILGDQLHALAAEIDNLQGDLLHPYADEVYELAYLQLVADAYGDFLTDEKLIANLEGWLAYAEGRVAEIRAEEEVRADVNG